MSSQSKETSVDRCENVRTGMSIESLKQDFYDNLFCLQGRPREAATLYDLYTAAAYTVRDRMLDRWIKTAQAYKKSQARTVCYLSAEFLIGPQLGMNMINLKILDRVREAAASFDLDVDLTTIADQEPEPGLGNGGLGRLAACYMDSLATLAIPAIGYGIRYEFGIFEQRIEDGWQVEVTDAWLRNGNPWELERHKLRFPVLFGGHTEQYRDQEDALRVRWIPELVVNGVAYDTPVVGAGVTNTNLLRLWRSEAPSSFDFQAFNSGDYYGAVHAKLVAENISKVLYPNDEPEVGKELRLRQQYFFVSCSLQDMIRIQLNNGGRLEAFHEKYSAQLNDTHPSVAVPELMRLLVDEHHLPWERAWEITRCTFAYTNHTLLPEALEKWPVALFGRLLPRHLEIVYEINRRFLDQVRIRFFDDEARVARMSLIDEQGERSIRMAHLASVGSYAINGVAALHTELLKGTLLRDFHELWPDKIRNVTNGVTPRRFLVLSNPPLAHLIQSRIGEEWVRDLQQLRRLEPLADESGFQTEWRAVKIAAKRNLARRIREASGVTVNPESLFDIQVKRIHEYKRQHLNLLHVLTLYNRLKQDPGAELVPRTFIFGGKAAPGYHMAKLIIKLINAVAEVIDRDPAVRERLKVVFFPNFNVKNAQHIYPAADLSEQISTAGMEASGTGNMKFAMNGALTIGTLDGANVEIREEVGKENFFLFGMDAGEVAALRRSGYRPWEFYDREPELREVVDLIDSGLFSHGDTSLFRPLTDGLKGHDPYLLLADYHAYVTAQQKVSSVFADRTRWDRMSILNTARMGKFSSDRSIKEYCDAIWGIPSGMEVGGGAG